MKIQNYTLKIGKKTLLTDVNVSFAQGKITHILEKNGTGKSQFAKDLLLRTRPDETLIISSYARIPNDLRLTDLQTFLAQKFSQEKIDRLSTLLNLSNIDPKLAIKKLSDGQKRKLEILTFFLSDKSIIILDELTNALDQTTIREIYQFLNAFIRENPDKIILNITHEMQDLTNLTGDLYLLNQQNLTPFSSVDSIIESYVRG
ncbi:putative peptide export ATP-binding protein YydI [Lactococcus hodotermopsidis]|uniref:Putative peptide export ATP-binding protein YydI n=1 Tax=Pseudolactococcus hodotermopsidis TaxID=2709157 RepID=A0A6A0BET3_9LACT|nr:ATP-binding cassette domain-containing protein [Lactococcus hodotermopsidis]GFH43215.1 putative peptide export ATP-binding protein YydI [Lactococcus hodotermopsidis]